uniref:Retrotransposon Copia-like N-terminal domain-containing protein n=1 Tax=Cannabis sativa TaxID=3483 RepID=A0A803PR34_CANSA
MSSDSQNPRNNNPTQPSSAAATSIVMGASSSKPQFQNPLTNHFRTLNQPFSFKLDRHNYNLWKTCYFTNVLQIEARPNTSYQGLQEMLLSFDSKIERLQGLSSNGKSIIPWLTLKETLSKSHKREDKAEDFPTTLNHMVDMEEDIQMKEVEIEPKEEDVRYYTLNKVFNG